MKFNLIQYILIFSLSFLLGAGAFYHFAKNHSDFICQIIGIVPPPEDDTPPINPDPAASSPSREGNLVSEDAAGTGSVYQQPSTPPQTPMPGGPQNNQGQGPAPEVNQVYPQLARKIREYRSACADATLEFTKISELGKFLEKNPNCDATLKNYYEIYKAAYEALRVLVPQNSKTYEGTLDDFRKICIPINETANMSTELTTFRDCFQVIFLKDGKGQNIVFNELAWNPRSLDFSKYTSFSSLKQLKADIEISKYE